jgi:hypothetical protein
MAQEDPNIFFRELIKSKPKPETRSAWLANHLKLVELGEKKEEKKVREKPIAFVRDDGSIRFASGKITFGFKHRGYHYIRASVHRAVAEAFVENPRPDIFDMVDHIDHDKSNNHCTNLRWLDAELNGANRKNSRNACFEQAKKKWIGYYIVGSKRTAKYFDTEAEAYEWAQREKKKAWQKLYEKKLGQTKP